jgi:hypothetical protein
MNERTQSLQKARSQILAACIVLAVGALPFAAARAAAVGDPGSSMAAPGATALAPTQSKTSMLPALASTDVLGLYQGTTAFTTVSFERIELPVTQSGTFAITLTDLLFPSGAANLSFALVDGDAVLGVINGSGSLQYSLVTSGSKTLFGYTYAVATPGFNSGAYALDVSYAPVPLPAAGWLLLSGMGLLGFGVRRGAAPVIRRSYN